MRKLGLWVFVCICLNSSAQKLTRVITKDDSWSYIDSAVSLQKEFGCPLTVVVKTSDSVRKEVSTTTFSYLQKNRVQLSPAFVKKYNFLFSGKDSVNYFELDSLLAKASNTKIAKFYSDLLGTKIEVLRLQENSEMANQNSILSFNNFFTLNENKEMLYLGIGTIPSKGYVLFNPKLSETYQWQFARTIQGYFNVVKQDTLCPLVIGNYFEIGSHFLYACDSKVCRQLAEIYHTSNDSVAYYVKKYIEQFTSKKIHVFTGTDTFDLPFYHLDVFMVPIAKGNKVNCFYNSDTLMKSYRIKETATVDSIRVNLRKFKTYLVEEKIFDSIWTLPSASAYPSSGYDCYYTYTNLILDRKKVLLPKFRMPRISESIETITQFDAFVSLIETEAIDIFKAHGFDPKVVQSIAYASDRDGFLHCNFLPLYK